jgi:predicted O-methyltransferase YrrM
VGRRIDSTKKTARRPRQQHARAFSKAEIAAWYEGKHFDDDWTSWHFPNWMKLLASYRDRPVRVLEIGSWQGRSAIFFLNFLPRARLTCIDTFAGGQEHREAAARSAKEARALKLLERRFDTNVRAFAARIRKMKATSADALAQLGVEKKRFDVAYIDGGHRASEVYTDAAMTWPLMKRGGIVIFDDYQWREMPARLDNPGPGIDAFLNAIEGQYRIVHKQYQIAIVKR